MIAITGRPDTATTKSDFYYAPGDRWNRLEKPEDHRTALNESRRLYVGGLPRFKGQEDTNEQIRTLFAGFDVDVVSKLGKTAFHFSTTVLRWSSPAAPGSCYTKQLLTLLLL